MKKQCSSIEELNLMLALYPTQKKSIVEEAGKRFMFKNKWHRFVVAEDGNCALFNNKYELDDLSKIKTLTESMTCEDIKKINIPDSVESIGYQAFFNCTSLESINIPDSVKSIGECVFDGCTSLKSINIPDSMKNIEDGAFRDCTSLEKVVIPGSVKDVGFCAFIFCESLKEVIFKGKTINEVKSMPYYPWGIKDESIIRCEA